MVTPELFIPNLNPRFTGVSATASAVLRAHLPRHALRLVGHPLPGCPDPITPRAALRLSRTAPPGRPFAIWHLRRNPEMRLGLWARDVLRLPVRLVFTSAAIRRHSALPRWLISRMDAVIATTQEAASFVPGVRAVVPHGVDCARWTPAPDRAQAWGDLGHGGTMGFATVGRIRPEKGTDRFVDAMIALLPQHPGSKALVIGKALGKHQAFEADLRARVVAAGLSDRILFVGEIPSEDLPRVLRALTLLVALPRYEGYGMTPLEAMASGVPFVASDTGYFRVFSDGGKAGLVLDDPAQAVSAIDALLSAPQRFDTMANYARATAIRAHSIQTEAERISEVYEALWAKGEGRA